MRKPNSTTRRAFSLLEMVLALAIGMLLLGALYFTLNVQVLQMQAGRDVVTEGALARSILARIGNDITGQVGVLDQRLQQSVANAASGSTTTPATSTTGSTTTPAATTPATSTTSSTTVTFNVGVQGPDPNSLTLSVYRMQRPTPDALSANPTTTPVSDLRVISYWVIPGGDGARGGLARKEFQQATNNDINTLPTSLPDPTTCIIAEEVSNIMFEYFDGQIWQTTWDGTLTDPPLTAGAPTVGPPLAIRITLTLRNNLKGAANDQGTQYQHIVAIPGANFVNPQTTTSP